MKTLQTFTKKLKVLALYAIFLAFCYPAIAQDEMPFEVKEDLFDQSNENTLGLTIPDGVETVTVFKPTETTDHFCNGIVMAVFKGYFYCMWQSSQKDEDAADTWIAYSRSEDGVTWTEPMVLAETIENGYCSSGGWWVAGDTLVGYINTWPASISPRGGYTRYTTSTDGMEWTEPQAVLMANGDTLKGIFEQDPHALPDGRIINAAHFQPGLIINPIYTDDPKGISGWTKGDFTSIGPGDITREIEPSWFYNEHGDAVMIFRDQNSSFKKLAAISKDRGETWSQAVKTDMPDARTKQSAGNFEDGTAFFVGNPNNDKLRLPLAITLSPNGIYFNTAYLLRASDDHEDLIYEGKAKRAGYHYPKSMIWDGYLYVAYANNKETVEYTRVPIANLAVDPTTEPPLSSNAYLSKIKLDPSADLSPVFSKDITEYTAELPMGTSTVNVKATKTHDKATISGDGDIDVSSGSATALIEVTAEDGTVKAYKIDFTVSTTGISDKIQANKAVYVDGGRNVLVIEEGANIKSLEIFSIDGKQLLSLPKVKSHEISLREIPIKKGSIFLVKLVDAKNTYSTFKLVK